MAESINSDQAPVPGTPGIPHSVDEARALARQRFKERLENGETVGNCDCHTDTPEARLSGEGPVAQVAGVRFLDSGQTFFFECQRVELELGDWVVVETTRGREAGRVVLAPHQIRASQLDGDLKPISRKLEARDIEKMNRLKRDAADAVKTFGRKIREHKLPMKPISAEYAFDGSHLMLNFSAPDRVDFRELAKDLASVFRCRIELRQVGARDEARLLGGVGRCGRTLCCSSWLPMFPDISMGMAKTQDLPLNPQKVSGVCGRLLCCLSYENEQYKQMKAIMPRLGQPVNTPSGPGMVVSMQILRESITVRLEEDSREEVFPADTLGFGTPRPAEAPLTVHAPKPSTVPVSVIAELPSEEPDVVAPDEDAIDDAPSDEKSSKSRSRRRRRSRGGRGGQRAN